jgi:two-component system, NarL family, sensor histidine kinase LiaS
MTALDHLTKRLKYEMEDRRRGLAPSSYFGLSDFTPEALSLEIRDTKANILAQAGSTGYDANIGALISELISAALRNDDDESHLRYDGENGLRLVAVPIISQDQKVLGAFVVRLRLPAHWWEGVSTVGAQGEIRIRDLVIAVCWSLAFGGLLARQLTKRLDQISKAADAWSRGDLAARADDRSADELGALSRHLNRMAAELQEVVTLRQNLAASEERNRLARDLHDTVKQRAFGLSLQIAAAQAMLGPDPQVAQARLAEAEKLVHQIQQELVGILQDLRPAVPLAQGLESAVKEYIADWSRQNGIAAELRYRDLPELTTSIEETILRILQESLANVARHSQATNVAVQLGHTRGDTVTLSVEDNGHGFDPEMVAAGMGLQNMSGRAASLWGGWFALESHPGHGTRIEVGFRTDRQTR